MPRSLLVNRLASEEMEAALCSQCGQPTDNGEGYDGLCGSCADRLENAREKELPLAD
jgi:NMD protein affecting ribosome stability and mRNA decay